MADQLIFDQGASDALDVMAAPYAVTSMSSPAPPLETSTVGNIDTEGDLIAARRHQNRTVNLTVEVRGTSQANLESLLAPLQAKIAQVARQGGTLTRISSAGTIRIVDLLAADTYDPAFDLAYFNGHLATVQVGLLARPYARESSHTLTLHTKGTTVPALAWTETALPGDVPAIGSIVLHELDSVARPSVVWGVQAAANPRQLLFQAESRTIGGGSTVVTDTDASGGQAVLNTQTGPSQILTVDSSGGLVQQHLGGYRVLARLKVSSAFDLRLEFRWSSGVKPILAANPTTLPAAYNNGTYRLVDFGVIRIEERVVGTQRWTGELWKAGFLGIPNTVTVDTLYLVPVDGSAGELKNSLLADEKVEIRSDGVAYSGVGSFGDYTDADFEGDLLSLPVGGTLNFIVIPSAGYVMSAPYQVPSASVDTGMPDLTAQVFYTPRYLTVF